MNISLVHSASVFLRLGLNTNAEPKMDIGFLYFKFYKIRNFMEEHREKNIQNLLTITEL